MVHNDCNYYYYVDVNSLNREVHSMMIKMIKDSNPKAIKTFGEWIKENKILPSVIIGNWEDVVANIKVQQHKIRATENYSLYGNEYPLDTPLFQDDESKGYIPIREEDSDGTKE